jgi:ferrochelatase
MNSDSETRLARRSFPESEGQGWCSDESGLDDPRPLEPHMRVVNRPESLAASTLKSVVSTHHVWRLGAMKTTAPGFGFVLFAELWNGRLAMLGFVIGLATEWLSGQGILGQIGLRF